MERRQDPRALLHAEITRRILKVFFDVYNELGFGFRELVYQRAMGIALTAEGLGIRRNVEWPVWFRGDRIASFQPDLVVNDGPVLIELKSKNAIEGHDVAQALNYLRASDVEVALILNFGKRPDYMRRVFENGNKRSRLSSGPIEVFPEPTRRNRGSSEDPR
jgi:GxxExxY protein